MYLILDETTHFSEDGWQTMCEENVEEDTFLYETDHEKVEDLVDVHGSPDDSDDEPTICSRCQARIEARTATLIAR